LERHQGNPYGAIRKRGTDYPSGFLLGDFMLECFVRSMIARSIFQMGSIVIRLCSCLLEDRKNEIVVALHHSNMIAPDVNASGDF
jgi:hypothetical protein